MSLQKGRYSDCGLFCATNCIKGCFPSRCSEVLKVCPKSVSCRCSVIRCIRIDQMIEASLFVKLRGICVWVVFLADGGRQLTIRNIGILWVLLSNVIEYRHRPSPSGSF